jgi:hypothetical protein
MPTNLTIRELNNSDLSLDKCTGGYYNMDTIQCVSIISTPASTTTGTEEMAPARTDMYQLASEPMDGARSKSTSTNTSTSTPERRRSFGAAFTSLRSSIYSTSSRLLASRLKDKTNDKECSLIESEGAYVPPSEKFPQEI